MKRLAFLAVLLLPLAAHAQCAGGLIGNCPAAVSPQNTDIVLGWQPGQNPHTRAFTLGQIATQVGSNFLPLTGGSLSGSLSVTGTTALNGGINLNGVGTSGEYDGEISVSGGGSQSGQGAVNVTASAANFLAYDSTEQFGTGLTPGAAEFWQAQGGTTGMGGTLYATNGTLSGNVDGNFVTQGEGNFWFGSGSGTLAEIADPGAPATVNLVMTPGTSATNASYGSTGNTTVNAPSGSVVYLTVGGLIMAEIENVAGATAPTRWPIFYSDASSGFAHITFGGTDANVNGYLSAQGTGNIDIANSSGVHVAIVNSNANTATDSFVMKAASSTTPLEFYGNGGSSIAVGGGSLATTATSGFLMIPYGAGPPTGTPSTTTNGIPIYFDTTDLKLCAYSSSAWKCSGAFS